MDVEVHLICGSRRRSHKGVDFVSGAIFNGPSGITTDDIGNIVVCDFHNHVIKKIDENGTVSTFSGSGDEGNEDGASYESSFRGPNSITLDQQGNLFITDMTAGRVRRVNSLGEVSTIADGITHAAGIDVDGDGNLFIASPYCHVIFKIEKSLPTQKPSIIAGTGDRGYVDGSLRSSMFDDPQGIVISKDNEHLFVCDSKNHVIRQVDLKQRQVTTLAGSGMRGALDGDVKHAQFGNPNGITIDPVGNIIVADSYNHNSRMISPNRVISTITGSNPDVIACGPYRKFMFYCPQDVTIDKSGNIIVTDLHTIVKIIWGRGAES